MKVFQILLLALVAAESNASTEPANQHRERASRNKTRRLRARAHNAGGDEFASSAATTTKHGDQADALEESLEHIRALQMIEMSMTGRALQMSMSG